MWPCASGSGGLRELVRVRGFRLIAAAALSCLAGSAAHGVDTKDVPWDEIDRILKDSQAEAQPSSGPQPRSPAADAQSTKTPPAAPALPSAASTPSTTGVPSSHMPTPTPDDSGSAPPSAAEAPAPRAAETPPQAGKRDDPTATGGDHSDTEQRAESPAPGHEASGKTTSGARPDAVMPAEPPNAAAPVSTSQTTAAPSADDLYLPLVRYISAHAADTLAKYNAESRRALLKLYETRMGQPLWVTHEGYGEAAKAIIETLKKADGWGLRADDYAVPDLPLATGSAPLDNDVLAAAEVRLALAAMQYAIDARGGRIPSPETLLSSYLDRRPQPVDAAALLKGLVDASDKAAYLNSFQPKQPQFQKLREKLGELRTKGPAPPPIPDGPLLKPGKSHPQVALVRERLGPASPAKEDGQSGPDFFDPALAEAVVAFKQKNGLSPVNANITNALRRALSAPREVSEATLIANMEEWRWMPEKLGDDVYISVNIPEFLVRLVRHDKVVFEERIVSGKPETQTPIFSNVMRTVVFQPRWNVPESIKLKELLPGLRAGGNPVAKEGLVMTKGGRRISPVAVDWSRADIRNYEVYQPPGPRNALGIVKFLFPNKHAVYLHDTPVKSLFNASVRTFSHGCMRVRNPLDFAEAILKQDKAWEADEVKRLATSGPEENEIKLDHPIPVHVTYFTAVAAEDGSIQSFADVYGHEKRISLALAGRWNEIERNGEQTISPDDAPLTTADGWADQREEIQRWQRAGNGDDHWDPDAEPVEAPAPKRKRNFLDKALRQVFGGV